MDLEQAIHRHDSRGCELRHRPLHRLDVPENLFGGDIGRWDPHLLCCLGTKQAASTDFETLNVRRGDGLSAKEQPSESFCVEKTRSLCI